MSNAGLPLVKQFEGCKLKAYRCPAGVFTIGYGHTSGVHQGQVITQAQAEQILLTDYLSFQAGVLRLVKVKLTDNQLGALCSFAFNVGLGNLRSSTLLKMVNAGRFTEAAQQFLRWDRAAGKVLRGLTIRRAAEAHLFLT